MGYVFANPMEFAWTPEASDLVRGPEWGLMFGYMALFGLTGLFYSLDLRPRYLRR